MAIKKTPKGYQIRWYDCDSRERKRTYKGVDRKEAERIEREILAERDRGEPQHDPRRAPTFGSFAAEWLAERRAAWKPSTQFQYDQVLKKHLLPRYGEARITAIRESAAMALIGELKKTGLSPRRINLILLVLKMILKAARRHRWLRDDPLLDVTLLEVADSEVDPLNPEEIDAFLAGCPPWWKPYFTVSLWTGARPGELAALKWSDIDATSGHFRIRAARYRGIESTPKTTKSVRDIVMLPPVVDALKAQKAQQAAARLKSGAGTPPPEADYVFTGPNGGFLNLSHLRDSIWYPTLTKSGLRRRVMYQTRHTFASNALAGGESPAWVAKMLGHATAEMLFKVYHRYIPNPRRDGNGLCARLNHVASTAPIGNCDTTEMRPLVGRAAGE